MSTQNEHIENIVNKKYIPYMFPNLLNKSDYLNLKIDKESTSYISTKDVANHITTILQHHIEKLGLHIKNSIITDATAGVGGNTLSFARRFNKVHAIEINEIRYNYLINNIGVYKLNNVVCYNKSCINLINTIDSNIVFFDPPWGGKDYKKQIELELYISEVPLTKIVNDLILSKSNVMQFIVGIKIPKNFALEKFYNECICKNIFLYELKKMNIIVIVENNK